MIGRALMSNELFGSLVIEQNVHLTEEASTEKKMRHCSQEKNSQEDGKKTICNKKKRTAHN